MTNPRHDLWLGHFVRRFEGDGARRVGVFLEPLFQFALGLAGAEDQDRFGITEPRNDRVVVARKMPGIFSLARIIRWHLLPWYSNRPWSGSLERRSCFSTVDWMRSVSAPVPFSTTIMASRWSIQSPAFVFTLGLFLFKTLCPGSHASGDTGLPMYRVRFHKTPFRKEFARALPGKSGRATSRKDRGWNPPAPWQFAVTSRTPASLSNPCLPCLPCRLGRRSLNRFFSPASFR